jgi:hypothetical protein
MPIPDVFPNTVPIDSLKIVDRSVLVGSRSVFDLEVVEAEVLMNNVEDRRKIEEGRIEE